VQWQTGDYITQVKLTQHNDNDVYCRDRTDTMSVPCGHLTASGDLPVTVRVYLDGAEVASASGLYREAFKIGDIDISGLAEGQVHTLHFSYNGTATGSVHFVKLQDHNYMTVWGWIESDPLVTGDTYRLAGMEAITSRNGGL